MTLFIYPLVESCSPNNTALTSVVCRRPLLAPVQEVSHPLAGPVAPAGIQSLRLTATSLPHPLGEGGRNRSMVVNAPFASGGRIETAHKEMSTNC